MLPSAETATGAEPVRLDRRIRDLEKRKIFGRKLASALREQPAALLAQTLIGGIPHERDGKGEHGSRPERSQVMQRAGARVAVRAKIAGPEFSISHWRKPGGAATRRL